MGVNSDLMLFKVRGTSWGDLKKIFEGNDYAFFTKPFDLNIFGIRNSVRQAGEWDDLLGVAYRDGDLNEHVLYFEGTTDPSDKWLKSPLNKNGTIAILTGQYRSVYKLGIHGRTWASGGYPALEQVGKFKYIRDNNRDEILDLDNKPFWGVHKTNLHRASQWSLVDRIGSYSAGCQVVHDIRDFNALMFLARTQHRKLGIDTFTYTLFDIDEFKPQNTA